MSHTCHHGRPPPQSRDKRTNPASFFEPVYDPADCAPFDRKPWPAKPKERVERASLEAEGFKEFSSGREKTVLDENTFYKCDFEGDFSNETPSFKNCRFEWCDFGLSIWRRARFKGCTFTRCSFTIATFEKCEFRRCNFSEIGLSGNETVLDGSTFTNPHELIESAYTNLDPQTLNSLKKDRNYQIMRLQQTKSTVARNIMHNHIRSGDERAYYESIRVYQNSSIQADILRFRYDLSQSPGAYISIIRLMQLFVSYIERILVNSAGFINDWGESVARPALFGFLLAASFAMIYWIGGTRATFIGAILTSIDITLLVGYTKHATMLATQPQKFLFCLNMLLGICWYSVFLPTLINRVSRVR